MSSNAKPCPIWGKSPSAGDIAEVGRPYTSPRAGGSFTLMQSGAASLHRLSRRQKANLSYWIYEHNLRYRRFDGQAGGELLVVDQAWVEGNRDRTPSTSDRMLTLLRELIRCDDADEKPSEELQMAAGSCRGKNDLNELITHARKRGWTSPGPFRHMGSGITDDEVLELSARIHVEEQLGVQGLERQGFVAMWFDPSMDEVYDGGIKPALEAAGYEARLIKEKEYLGKVDDEIVAEIRRSRFIVADFTASKKAGARGGVYYEAGFAEGLGIPVIYTCRKDRMKAVHFDTNHFNHIVWETPEELRTKLHNRIEAVLGRGPL